MSYPESSAVSAGDATHASHYNNLRLDALYMGKAATNAIALATLLERFETRLQIERLNTDQLRVVASATAPVSLMVDGYMVQAVANVDLAADQKPSGGASAFYIFANRADSSTTFTLTVSTSSTEAANQRRIGRFYWDSAAIIEDSVRSEFAVDIANLLYYVDPQICDGRLTVSTGVPVPFSDVSSSGNVYFTPYTGNRIALYVNNYGWRLYSFAELTLSLAGVDSGKNLDVWIYDNAGTLTLANTEWSNDTLRATAITRQDGVLVKSGSPEYRYLGTVRTSGAAVTADTELLRFVWNMYHRLPRKLKCTDDTDTWSLNSSTWREWNGSQNNRVAFVIGVDESPVSGKVVSTSVRAGGASGQFVGIDLDGVIANDSDITSYHTMTGMLGNMFSEISKYCGIGYHFYQMMERGTVGQNVTFYGDNGGTDAITGFIGEIIS